MSQRERKQLFRRSASLVGAASFIVLFAGLGCAGLIGVKDGEWDGKVTDEDTGVRTSEQCVSYCDEVLKNCSGENAVYQSRAACLNTCNHLPPGDPDAAEPEPNTVVCRMEQAKNAKSFPADACPAAGPAGNGDCGTTCESWCLLLEEACVDDFEALADCKTSCAAIPAAPGYNIADGYEADANNIQCRIAHLGAALGGPDEAVTHCPHTKFMAEGACDGDGTASGEPTCEGYCQAVMGACTGENQQYLDATECGVACFLMETGSASDTSQNSLGCRTYHAGNALNVPDTHCSHAGPTGDGQCGSGPCQSYCRMFDAVCSAEIGDFDSTAACETACEESGLPGIAPGSGYSFETAFASDSLQCRIRSIIFAKGADPSELQAICNNARLFGTCTEP